MEYKMQKLMVVFHKLLHKEYIWLQYDNLYRRYKLPMEPIPLALNLKTSQIKLNSSISHFCLTISQSVISQ